MAQVRQGKIMTTIQVDGAKVGFGGFLYRVIAFDTARHIVPCLSVWSASNESTNSWAKVGLKMNQLYGAAINNSEVSGISDRDKGLISGFFGELYLIREIFCHTHLKADVGRHCGSAAVKPFVRMAYATTVDNFNRLKSTAPANLLAFLNPLDESTWAKSHHKMCMGGRMSSSVMRYAIGFFCLHKRSLFLLQGIEGLNGADAASRGGFRDSADASELLTRMTETYQRRFLSRCRESVQAVDGALAPRVRQHLHKKLQRLEAESTVTVKFQDTPVNMSGFVIVGHARRPFKLGSFKESSCSCGGKEVDEEPCACLVKASLMSGFDLHNLVHERDSTVTWKQQYKGLPEFKLPSTEEIDACPADKFLVAASSYPVPRGRPSTKRMKGAIDFWAKKKKRALPTEEK